MPREVQPSERATEPGNRHTECGKARAAYTGSRRHLLFDDDAVELREGGHAEEDVDDAGGQSGGLFPLLPQCP